MKKYVVGDYFSMRRKTTTYRRLNAQRLLNAPITFQSRIHERQYANEKNSLSRERERRRTRAEGDGGKEALTSALGS